MRRLGFLIAAILLVGLFWGGVTELVERLGIQVWLRTKLEASDKIPQKEAIDQER